MTILPVTSELRDGPLFRIAVAPSAANGLRKASQVTVDNPQTVARTKIGKIIGRLDDQVILGVNRALAVFLEFA